ncbi:MAG: hypothetical protein M3P00_07765 [Gemmatimonadota bacterium]|nr:hypothetical protein [Gemmatimonadota bacterium]
MSQSTKQMAYLFRHVRRRKRSLNQLLHRPIRLANRIVQNAWANVRQQISTIGTSNM